MKGLAALLDINVLLALAWPNHQHHQAAHQWFDTHGAQRWATCALTQLGFIRLSSNPAYSQAEVSPANATALLKGWIGHPKHLFWHDLPAPNSSMFTRTLGHQQVMDAYLLHLAGAHKGFLATFDRRILAQAPDSTHVYVIPS